MNLEKIGKIVEDQEYYINKLIGICKYKPGNEWCNIDTERLNQLLNSMKNNNDSLKEMINNEDEDVIDISFEEFREKEKQWTE